MANYGNYPDVPGHTLLLGGESYQVIGVIGPSFETEQFIQNPDIWIPIQINPSSEDVGGEFVFAAGRLKPGETLDAARGRLEPLTKEYLKRASGGVQSRARLDAAPLRDAMVGRVKTPIVVLFGAVSLILLIACTNVSNLLLIQATGRKRELAIRAALGASRGRLIRQLLTESGVLAFIGGAIGLLVGFVGVRFVMAWYPEKNPFLIGMDDFTIRPSGVDWRVLLFTLGISVLATILFGLAPALKASRTDVFDWLKQTGNTSTSGIRQNKTRSFLVVAEMAMALTLLIGAILLIRTTLALQAVDPGFDTTNVLTLRMAVTGTRFDKRDGIEELTRIGTQRIRVVIPPIEPDLVTIPASSHFRK
jgi:predicted permease